MLDGWSTSPRFQRPRAIPPAGRFRSSSRRFAELGRARQRLSARPGYRGGRGRSRCARGSFRGGCGRVARSGCAARYLTACSRELRVDPAGWKAPCEEGLQDVPFRPSQAMPSASRLFPVVEAPFDSAALDLDRPTAVIGYDVNVSLLWHGLLLPGSRWSIPARPTRHPGPRRAKLTRGSSPGGRPRR
jgi:hypothetical protein